MIQVVDEEQFVGLIQDATHTQQRQERIGSSP